MISFSGLKTALMQFVRKQPEGFVQQHIHDHWLPPTSRRSSTRSWTGPQRRAGRAGAAPWCWRAAWPPTAGCAVPGNALPEGTALRYPPVSLCADNAAMIASAAWYRLMEGETAGLDCNASPGLPFADM